MIISITRQATVIVFLPYLGVGKEEGLHLLHRRTMLLKVVLLRGGEFLEATSNTTRHTTGW
jgi:hypothetical protein